MRLAFILSFGVCVLAAIAFAADDWADNKVAYHRHTIPNAGDLILIAPRLDHLEGASLNDILGTQLPVNSKAHVWNGTGYDISTRVVFFGPWSPNRTVIRGQALFVELPSTQSNVTFTLTGEIPDESNGGGTTTVSVIGLDAVSYPYPAEIEFGDTQTAITAAVNSAVFFWNVDDQEYDAPVSKSVFFGWGSADTRDISIGEGFFMETPTNKNIDAKEVQPYQLCL